MDIYGHVAMDQKEYDRWNYYLNHVNFPVRVGVGTNEDVKLSKEDIKIKEITQVDYEMLKKLSLKRIGHINCIELEDYADCADYPGDDEDCPDEDEEDGQ